MATQSNSRAPQRYEMLQIGGSNYVAVRRILGVFEPSTAAVKRMIREAKVSNKLVDVSRHREVRSVLIMDTGDIIATFLTPEEVTRRLGPVSEAAIE